MTYSEVLSNDLAFALKVTGPALETSPGLWQNSLIDKA
jgi:hypothetical protein